MDIRNKVAIVTGGASGIGSALAERLAAEGARGIAVADINLPAAEALARSILGAGDVVAAIRDETFLVLPHPDLHEYVRCKAQDCDRRLGGMQKFQAHQSGTMPTEKRTAS